MTNGLQLRRLMIGMLALLAILLAAGMGYEALMRLHDRRAFPPPGDFVDIDGARIHFDCSGPESDVTVMLEAGAGGALLDWSSIQPLLAQRVRVCAYDRAGLGWSDRNATPRDAQAIARDFEALLDRADIRGPLILAGHSYGGLLVRHFARANPERVRGLVLVDALHESFVAGYSTRQKSQQKTQIAMLNLAAMASTTGLPRLLGLAAAPAAAPEETRRAILSRAYLPKTLRTIADEAAMVEASIEMLARLEPLPADFPITVISRSTGASGDAVDESWANTQAKLARLTNQTQFVTSAGGDHYIQFAEPDLVAREIFALLDRLSG